MPFPDQLTLWLSLLNEERPLDLTKLNLTDLVKQFNLYIDLLSHQAEIFNLWNHEPHSNINIFARYHKGEAQAIFGNAFVAQYRESTILKRLFSLNPKSGATSRFEPYEKPTVEYKKEHQDSFWSHIEAVLNRGYDVITYLHLLKKIHSLSDEDFNNQASIKEHVLSLKQGLEKFMQVSKILNDQLKSCPIKLDSDNQPKVESPFFYPISDNELSLMNGEQLVTICLEELYATKPSLLLERLFKRDDLWEKIERAYEEGNFSARVDNPQAKMRLLKQWRNDFVEFRLQKNNFDRAENLDKKQVVFETLTLSYENLPEFLQESEEISTALNQRKELLISWQKSNELYLVNEKIFLKASNARDRITVYSDLKSAFNALPIRLQESYQVRQQNYQEQVEDDIKEIIYLQCLASLNHLAMVSARYSIFEQYKRAFDELPHLVKTKYQAEFDSLQASNLFYKELLRNNVIAEYEPVEKINAVLQRLQVSNHPEDLKEAVFTDHIFWQAISLAERESLSAEIAHDLLILKTFYQTKYKSENDKIFGKEYNQSLTSFYKAALNIRLSSLSIPQQVKAITDKAHSLFQPRHTTRRLLADVLMVVSVLFAGLGLAIMARRHSKNKPIFFSQAITSREDELTKEWLVKSFPEDKTDDISLFHCPAISVKA
ncbi:LepB GTPase-activating domain-containing protein [Legionella sp. CNM-1927-20]|uniref:LepB GTPase-activating domain-containing protein n=1 Tax=Legionella sp. CNM-1927-20 TaxID=3422221 RepID=UPI00403AF3EA